MRDSDKKVVIIGMGFLATYVMSCYQELLGDRISENLIGIKGSERGLKEKQAECNFPVIAGRALETLKERKPDIIVLAVKPHQIAGVVNETLKPYYELLRKEGKMLPELYSFAPDPTVSYYYDTLGSDVFAVNMIPNMVSVIAGVNVAKAGVCYVAFDSRKEWSPVSRRRALEFLEPVGTVVEIDGDKAIPFLALQVACHLMFELNYIVQDVMGEFGKNYTLADSASAYRAQIHKFFADDSVYVLPSGEEQVDERLIPFMETVMRAWYQGVLNFAREEEIPDEPASRMICGSMETYQMEPQMEPKELLVQNTKNHATPGGFLEMCMNTFNSYGYEYTTDALRAWMKGEEVNDLEAEITKIAHDVAKAISDHGKTVSGINK